MGKVGSSGFTKLTYLPIIPLKSYEGPFCMNIQIIGTKKCKETRKAHRFFQDRGIKFHTLDLKEKGLSRGELNNILSKVSEEEIVNKEAPLYKKKFAYLEFDPHEELLEFPELVRTPVVRCDKEVTVGYTPEIWKQWLADN